MYWYDGSIAEAVNLSKQKNAIFVVFVEADGNEQSTEMSSTIDNASVLKLLSDQSNFLAIKLKSGSTDYTHFARIYQFVPVPSLFFIGRNGTPLEVVCAGVEPDNLASRISRILEEHHRESPAVKPSTSSESMKQQTANLLKSEASAPVQAESFKANENAAQSTSVSNQSATTINDDPLCVGGVCRRRPANREDGPSKEATRDIPTPSQPDTSALEQEKQERAKELIEMRRKEKAEKEKELERQKELERRSAGQGVAELKKWQQDQELKQMHEERKREKLENNLARQKILEQIAQDRAERRARDTSERPQEVRQTTNVNATDTCGDAGVRARIMLKLPGGAAHAASFRADDTVADVARYVADTLHLSNFTLWTAFPRRDITSDRSTLRALRLVPSAALLVLGAGTGSVSTRPRGLAAVVAFITQLFSSIIVAPAQNLFAWFTRRAPSPPIDPPATTPRSSPPRPTPPRRGNVHRLREDRDDDNNTWNGNSTQQM